MLRHSLLNVLLGLKHGSFIVLTAYQLSQKCLKPFEKYTRNSLQNQFFWHPLFRIRRKILFYFIKKYLVTVCCVDSETPCICVEHYKISQELVVFPTSLISNFPVVVEKNADRPIFHGQKEARHGPGPYPFSILPMNAAVFWIGTELSNFALFAPIYGRAGGAGQTFCVPSNSFQT